MVVISRSAVHIERTSRDKCKRLDMDFGPQECRGGG